jgi:hypothetical protein
VFKLTGSNHCKVNKLYKSFCSAHYLLQHYTEFDIRTIIMLKKLFGVGFFGDFIRHLIFCQVTFFWASSTSFL